MNRSMYILFYVTTLLSVVYSNDLFTNYYLDERVVSSGTILRNISFDDLTAGADLSELTPYSVTILTGIASGDGYILSDGDSNLQQFEIRKIGATPVPMFSPITFEISAQSGSSVSFAYYGKRANGGSTTPIGTQSFSEETSPKLITITWTHNPSQPVAGLWITSSAPFKINFFSYYDGCNADSDCADSSLCTIDTCNTTTGVCANTPKTCTPSNECKESSCNAGTGNCDETDKTCSPSADLCLNAICVVGTGCTTEPKSCNSSNFCLEDHCDSNIGCYTTNYTCPEPDACNSYTCDIITQQCESSVKNCDDSNPDSYDYCDGGCQHNFRPTWDYEDIYYNISKNYPLWADLYDIYTDPEGDSVDVDLVYCNGPYHGEMGWWSYYYDDDDAEWGFWYVPDENWVGTDYMTFEISDYHGGSHTIDVTIDVYAINSPPLVLDDYYYVLEDTIVFGNVQDNDYDWDDDFFWTEWNYECASTTYVDDDPTYSKKSTSCVPDYPYYIIDWQYDKRSLAPDTGSYGDIPVDKRQPWEMPEYYYNYYADAPFNVFYTQYYQIHYSSAGDFIAIPSPNAGNFWMGTPYIANDLHSYSWWWGYMSIWWTPVNDRPVLQSWTYYLAENSYIEVNATDGIFNHLYDVDTSEYYLSVYCIVPPAAARTFYMNTDGSFYYEPNPNFYGYDLFTLVAYDYVDYSDSVTFAFFVSPVDNVPVAQNDFAEVLEDGSLWVDAPGLIANDVDLDNFQSELAIVEYSDAEHGTVVVHPNGSYSYTPNANFAGIDSFQYILSYGGYAKKDGIIHSNVATVVIEVVAVDDAPVAVGESYTTDQATVLIVDGPGVLKNDYDVDNQLVTPVLVSPTSNGVLRLHLDGGFIYTPNRLYVGLDSFTYYVWDGSAGSANVTAVINVTRAPNAPPVAVYDSYNLDEGSSLTVNAANGVLHNDRDLEGSSLTAILNSTTSRGSLTLNSDGSFTYVPDPYTYGYDFFRYWAYDGTDKSADVGIVWLLVKSVDNKPVPQNDDYWVNEDGTLTVNAANGVLHNDLDIDSATFTASVSALPSHGTLNLNSDGSFVYTPNSNFFGFDQFTYTANDGTLTSGIATVIIRVDAVNDAPVAVEDSYETNQNVPIVVDAPGLLENDYDLDSLILRPAVVSQPSNGTLKVQIDGSFVYTPDFFFFGEDSFTYVITDGFAESEIVTVSIYVNESDSAPVAVSDSYIITENNDGYDFTADYLLTLVENDSDAEGDALTLTIVDQPADGSLVHVNPTDGWVIFTPPKNFKGDVTFTYILSDGFKNSQVATVTLNVDTTYGFTDGEIAGIVISVVFLVVVIVLFAVCIILARKKQNQVKPMDR